VKLVVLERISTQFETEDISSLNKKTGFKPNCQSFSIVVQLFAAVKITITNQNQSNKMINGSIFEIVTEKNLEIMTCIAGKALPCVH
jgi:hypothetical protein